MGCDIHGVWQKWNGSAWDDIESNYEQDRHYQLFAVLADVRNGYGTAGYVTGERVEPIAERRGLPGDFTMVDEAHPITDLSIIDPSMRAYHQAHDRLEVWMGDHSHSWLTAEEMLDWYERAPTVLHAGVLDRHAYETWDKVSPPESYCGGISGRDVVQISDTTLQKIKHPNWTHIRCVWQRDLSEELAYFFDEVKRLSDLHGSIRFVFGFDS